MNKQSKKTDTFADIDFEYENLYIRLFNQQKNAFYCVATNSFATQINLSYKISKSFKNDEVYVIDFDKINNDFEYSTRMLIELINKCSISCRIILLVNFQLACGYLSEKVFLQTLNFGRDILAELPYIIVFMVPMSFRRSIAQNAPDFNSFFQYVAYFNIQDETQQKNFELTFLRRGYNETKEKLLEYYLNKYYINQIREEQQTFYIISRILQLNHNVRNLRRDELEYFYELFNKFYKKYKNVLNERIYDAAFIYYSHGNYIKALEIYKRALKKYKINSSNYQKITETLIILAFLCHDIGHNSEVIEWGEKALDLSKKKMDINGYDEWLAFVYNRVAVIYAIQGLYMESMESLENAQIIMDRINIQNYSYINDLEDSKAYIYYLHNEFSSSLDWYSKVINRIELINGVDHIDNMVEYNNIAIVHTRQGNYNKALYSFNKALKIATSKLINDHQYIAVINSNLAYLYEQQGKTTESFNYYIQALNIRKKVLGDDHPDTKKLYLYINDLHYTPESV